MKNRDNRVIIGMLLFICPIASVPLIFREIYNRRYYALGYLTIFMALLAYLWTPSGDLYKFYIEYDALKGVPFNQILENTHSKFDFIVQFLEWLFAKTGLNFEWFRFCTCIFCYTLVFGVTKKIVEQNQFGEKRKRHS